MKRGGAFFSRNMNMWLALGLLAVFILLAFLIYQYYSAASSNKMAKNVANMRAGANVDGLPTGGLTQGLVNGPPVKREGFANGTADIQAMFFNVDWCPHCVRAKPEWAKFVNKHANDSNITFVGGEDGTNCTDNDDSHVRDAIQKYKIEHFPTVIFVKNGTPQEFQGRVSADELEKFLDSL